MNRRAAAAALAALACAGALAPLAAQERGPHALLPVAPGSVATEPLFALPYVDLTNRPARLERPAGRPMLVNFWARWCGPCKVEIPELIALRAREPGIDVVGINIEADPEPVRDFARAYEIDYRVLVARAGALDLMRALGNPMAGLPFTVVLDGEGALVAKRVGLLTRAHIDTAMEWVRR